MERERRAELSRWMARLADGDREAFHPVYRAAWPVVRSFAVRVLGGSSEADDVAQQALLRVFARATEYDPQRDALTWMLAIAAYECKTARRRRSRSKEVPAAEPLEGHVESAEPEVIANQLLAAAQEVLGTLAAPDAEAILAYVGATERPPVSPACFRKRAQRALVRLRRAWGLRHGSE